MGGKARCKTLAQRFEREIYGFAAFYNLRSWHFNDYLINSSINIYKRNILSYFKILFTNENNFYFSNVLFSIFS